MKTIKIKKEWEFRSLFQVSKVFDMFLDLDKTIDKDSSDLELVDKYLKNKYPKKVFIFTQIKNDDADGNFRISEVYTKDDESGDKIRKVLDNI